MTQEPLILICPRCGAKNRVPPSRIKDKPLCGKCRSPLGSASVPDEPVTVTDQNFAQEVLDPSGAVVVDCWAPWCGPCRMIGPAIEQLAKEYAGRIKFAKLNTDENPLTASRYAVQSIPTLLFFKKGTLVHRLIGALPKREIERNLGLLL